MPIPSLDLDPIQRGDDWGVVFRLKNADKTVRKCKGADAILELKEDESTEIVVATPLCVVTAGDKGEIWATLSGFENKTITQDVLYGYLRLIEKNGTSDVLARVRVLVLQGDKS